MIKANISDNKHYYRFLSFFVLLTSLLFLPNPVLAANIVINEIMANPEDDIEWVELYNPSDQTVDLTGWEIIDNAKNTDITLSGDLPAMSIKAYDHAKGWLNDSSDEIVTLQKNGEIIDSYSYSKATPGKTFARFPDGGTWAEKVNPTKGLTNGNLPEPTATPTLIPTNTPTPTKTPTPTHSPTPTKSPTPTSTLTLIKTPTPTKIISPTLHDQNIDNQSNSSYSAALFNNSLSNTSSESPEVMGANIYDNNQTPGKFHPWLIIGGVAAIFGSIVFLLINKSMLAGIFKKS